MAQVADSRSISGSSNATGLTKIPRDLRDSG